MRGLLFKGIIGLLVVGTVGTASVAGISYNYHKSLPKINDDPLMDTPVSINTQQNISSPTTSNNDPIVNCPTEHLGDQRLPASQCEVVVECEINGGWSLYPNLEECQKAQNESNQRPNTPTLGNSSKSDGYISPINIAWPSLAPYQVSSPPPAQKPNVSIQSNPSPSPVPFGYGNFN